MNSHLITAYHAKYFAHELTCKHTADSVDRISQSLFDAAVDLNPHQIEAALFALSNPLQQGVLLADEVGLGKTIEAGLVLCQFWAERRRRLIIVCPATLRKQWSQELAEKFALPSIIVDNSIIKQSGLPAHACLSSLISKNIILMSYQFAAKLADELALTPWDLVVIDEAHKLRNAHRSSNRIGQALKLAFNSRRKVLLTATPLQNSLMELYGLSTLIDEHLFGDEKTFRKQYINTEDNRDALKQRLSGFIKRSLRSQVLEYVRYTQRQAITQPFNPSDHEQNLYEVISDFLQREQSFALPKQHRHLTSLMLRKLLASSPYAVIATLEIILERLKDKLKGHAVDDETIISNIFEHDEFDDDYIELLENDDTNATNTPNEFNQHELENEIQDIQNFIIQAKEIKHDTKAQALLTALTLGFAKMAEHSGPRKAIIFTESKRTQAFLADFLTQHGYGDKLVTFNGTNNSEQNNKVYQDWLKKYNGTERITGSVQVDKRTALIDAFRSDAEIMIATEAASEGVNLQFCALIINYDLPWNPQRVEQRIGRCHRYGQQHDVVVINFLNTRNHADQRVLELLTEKFQLFSGVFGASDEVLGRIESGIDFEKRIARIYDTCRKPEDIQAAFETLQKELEADINHRIKETQSKLLEHFDEDVHDKLKYQLSSAQSRLDKVGRWFWGITQYALNDKAQFDHTNYAFSISTPPIPEAKAGRYQLVKGAKQADFMAHAYRMNHPLGEWAVSQAYHTPTANAEIVFNYTEHESKVSVIADLLGEQGWLRLDKLSVSSLDTIDTLIFTGMTDQGQLLDHEICEKLFSVYAKNKPTLIHSNAPQRLTDNNQRRIDGFVARFLEENQKLFMVERDKLERWAEDKLQASEDQLKEIKAKIALVKRDASRTESLDEQSTLQSQIISLEKQQRKLRQQIFDVEDEIIAKRDALIDDLQLRLTQSSSSEHLFTIRWKVV